MRRALIVGIDDYPTSPLAGCVNDATRMSALLARNADNSPNFDVQLLTSDTTSITAPVLREAIERLFGHDEADIALLYFSGHGTENDLDGFLVTTDAKAYSEGVPLTYVLAAANQSRAREVIVILDSCMSGAFGQVPATGSTQSNIREGVAVLTASRAGQVSVEVGGRGLFTELVCGALDGGAADVLGDVTVASIYAYVEQALGPWEQRPMFKAHLAKLVPVRRAKPAVEPEILRDLPTWFPTADFEFPLDPSYEDTVEPRNEDHEQIFKKLQKCRDAKLVEAADEEFMYFAAMNSTGCRLTPLGRHYWRMAEANRI